MVKLRLKQTLLFILIAAFLAMQSASAHIHLAEHHDHDGTHHQHQSQTHTHQSIDSHDDVIDSSHQTNHAKVVELDHECSIGKGSKQENASAVVAALHFHQPIISESIRTELPVVKNTKLSHLYRSTVNLRAPPTSS